MVAMTMRLFDERTRDGSRHFASLPQGASWGSLCDWILLLPNAEIVNFTTGAQAQAWLDFHFRGHRFSIVARDGQLHFYVRDPQCPDLILYQIGCHFEKQHEASEKGEAPPFRCIGGDGGAA